MFLVGCGPDAACRDGALCRIAGTGLAGFDGDGRDARESALYLPSAVFRTPNGRLGIIDANNHRVREIADDGTLRTLVGTGEHGPAVDGATAAETPLDNPSDAVTGPDGLLYLAIEHSGRVVRIGADGRVVAVAGTGELGDDGDGGPAVDARLDSPTGLAFDDAGRLHVSDRATGRLRVIELDGRIRTEIPDLARPQRVSWDATSGRLLVADTDNGAIRACDPTDGTSSLLIDGLGAPQAAVASADGRVWIADADAGTVGRFDADGSWVPIIGDGARGFAPDPPARATEARLMFPMGLLVEANGDVYVADALQHAVFVCPGCAR